MASPMWVGVYCMLIFELVLTTLLVIPLPGFAQKGLLQVLALPGLVSGTKVVLQFIAIALSLALYDSINTIRNMDDKIQTDVESLTSVISNSLTRERKFRAQRNLYLTGFALCLFFVIMRLFALVRRQHELTDELKRKQNPESTSSGVTSPSVHAGEGTPMSTIERKTQ